MVDWIRKFLVIALMHLDGMQMDGRAHGVIDKHVFQVNEIIQIVQEE